MTQAIFRAAVRLPPPRLAGALLALTVAATVAAAWFGVRAHDLSDAFSFTPLVLAFAVVGAIVVARRSRSTIGWLFLGEGLGFSLAVATSAYAASASAASTAQLGVGSSAASWADWAGAVGGELGFLFALAILLFPDGRLPSRRWRPVAWLLVLADALLLGSALTSGAAMRSQGSHLPSPVRLIPESLTWPVVNVVQTLILPLSVVAAAGCVVRYRKADGDERHQIKWFAFSGAILAFGLVVDGVISHNPLNALLVLGPLVPVATCFAILKYRLYDIDVLISRALVYGSLAVFITGVYVLVVVVIGSAGAGRLANPGSPPSLAVSVVATAIVAVAFQPLRGRLQHLANRLVYGERATPYELLSGFTSRLGEAYATEDVLPRLAQMLAEGTSARRADVWLSRDGRLRPAAAWPLGAEPPGPVAWEDGDAAVPGADRLALVRHQGELLGALTVSVRPGETLTPVQDKLIRDLAGQAGLVLRNVGLTGELITQLGELTASRSRIVTAQDHERLRIQRDIRERAERRLEQLQVSLEHAQSAAGEDAQAHLALVGQLRGDVSVVVEELRELARGIYPPLLADQGLVAAVRAQAAKAAAPVTVDAHGIGRYPRDVETTLYFCCVEALRNAGMFAAGATVGVRLASSDDAIFFDVHDDGPGFDQDAATDGSGLQNMSDRVAALGGELGIRSRLGGGTTVSGRIPLAAEPAGS
jgi:signal transduction histidine kinase